MVKSWGTVAVVCLLVLAGCSAFQGSATTTTVEESTATISTSSGPTQTSTAGGETDNSSADATPTDLPPGVSYPPGAGPGGFTDVPDLLRAHETVLSNTSYALSVLERAGGEGGRGQRIELRSNLDGQRILVTTNQTGGPGALQLYINATTIHKRQDTGTQVSYDVRQLNVPFAQQHRRQIGLGFIRAVITGGSFEPTGTVIRNGRTLVVFTLTSTDLGTAGPDEVTQASGTVLVHPQGVVYLARLHVEGTEQGTAVVTDVQYRLVSLGDVTVQRPEWVTELTDGSN